MSSIVRIAHASRAHWCSAVRAQASEKKVQIKWHGGFEARPVYLLVWWKIAARGIEGDTIEIDRDAEIGERRRDQIGGPAKAELCSRKNIARAGLSE